MVQVSRLRFVVFMKNGSMNVLYGMAYRDLGKGIEMMCAILLPDLEASQAQLDLSQRAAQTQPWTTT